MLDDVAVEEMDVEDEEPVTDELVTDEAELLVVESEREVPEVPTELPIMVDPLEVVGVLETDESLDLPEEPRSNAMKPVEAASADANTIAMIAAAPIT